VAASNVIVHSDDGDCASWDVVAASCRKYARQNRGDNIDSDRATFTKIQELHHMGIGQGKSTSILVNLLHFHDTECKDGRDRLYAFFGISQDELAAPDNTGAMAIPENVNSAKIQFDVNYDLSVEETYAQFAMAVLRSAQAIDLLHCAGAFPFSRSGRTILGKKAWPSWVPDWRAPRLYLPLMRAKSCVIGLPVLETLAVKINEADMTITLPGYRYGSISKVDMSEAAIGGLLSFRVDYVHDGYIDMSVDRVPIKAGYFVGCGPSIVKVDDIVVALATAKTPFISRPLKSSSLFRIICDCEISLPKDDRRYIDIIMRPPRWCYIDSGGAVQEVGVEHFVIA
jgi:hypothetical protein